jgi:Fe2+ transport system protein FeoA
VPRTLPIAATPGHGEEFPDPRELFLADVAMREVVELVRIDLPDDQLEPLLERGLMPGCQICPVRTSPAGDPIVMVEGSLLALRRELACRLCVKHMGPIAD